MSKRRRTSSKAFTSDAEVILQFLEEMSSDDDSGSDSDFDGYVEDFDEDYARIECTDFQGIAKYKVPAAAPCPAGSSSARDLSPALIGATTSPPSSSSSVSTASPFPSSTEATSCNASLPSPVSLVQASHSSQGCTIPLLSQTPISLRPASSNATPIFSPASVSSSYGSNTTPLLSSTLVRADATGNYHQFSIGAVTATGK